MRNAEGGRRKVRRKAEGRGQRTEDRGQRAEGRGQGAEGRGQGAGGRGQLATAKPEAAPGGQRTEVTRVGWVEHSVTHQLV